ncbi:MAG: pitrilysin family protein [Myxococcota bacterium]
MRRVLWLSLLLASSALAAPKKAKPKDAPLIPFPVQATVLKNGLTVLRVKFASPGLVAWYTAVRVGSRNEVEAGHTGFAHFFEHMMFRGTKRFPEGSRNQLLGRLGFVENAYTSDDVTVYQVNGPASAIETLADVEADRFMYLDYSEPAFQTEAKAVLGEYHKNAANPALKMEEAVLGAAFTQHTYRHTTLGFYEDIQAMPTRYEYSKAFFQRWYTPDNCVLIIVGDFDDAKVMALVEKHYGPWQGKAASTTPTPEPAQTAARTASLTWTTPTLPRLGLYWHTPAASPKTSDGAIARVLGSYLAGPTSPLYKSLVLEQQLVERLGESADLHRDPHLFGVEAKLKAEAHRAAVEKAITDAVELVAKGTVDAKRLADIKDHLRFSLLMELETPAQVADALAWNVGILGAPDALEILARQTQAVTAKDLTAFAKKHLTEKNRTTLVFTVDVKGGGK